MNHGNVDKNDLAIQIDNHEILLATVRSRIHRVLAAPDIDLLNITTKHVCVLLEKREGVSSQWINQCMEKKDLDRLIREIFIEVLTDKEELDAQNSKVVQEDLTALLTGVKLSGSNSEDHNDNYDCKIIESLELTMACARII